MARNRIIINSNYYSAIYCSKYWFHSPHFSLKFCARHSCTSVLQKCAKTSIVCVSWIILPAVSRLSITLCGEVNLRLLGAAFPGVTDLVMNYSSLVEGSAGGSGDLFPHLQKVELEAVSGLSAPLSAVLSSGKWRRSGRKQSVKQSLCARWCCAWFATDSPSVCFFFPRKKKPLRLDSDGLWLQSWQKATNDAKHEKRQISCPKYRGKSRGKSGQIKRRDILPIFRYFKNMKRNQSARIEDFQDIKRNNLKETAWKSL